MPNDAFTLKSITHELQSLLKGGKVVKISQPESDEILLQIYKGINYKLLLSCNPSIPRIHLTQSNKENPLNAPNFCMLLRKHLTNATIDNVFLKDFERQVFIEFLAKNELFDTVKKYLIIEIMGKHSNIILTDDNYKIVAQNKTVTFDISSVRQIMSGLIYEHPPIQDKIPLISYQDVENLFLNFNGGDLKNYLISNISGISQATLNEFLFKSNLDLDKNNYSQIDAKRFTDIVKEYIDRIENNKVEPCVLIDNNGKPIDFFAFKYNSLSDNFLLFQTVNQAIDDCYLLKDKYNRFSERSKILQSNVKNELKKCEKKLATYLDKKLSCRDYNDLKKYGELIISYIYKIPNKAGSVTVEDYYNDMKSITIKLDKALSPNQNAQKYFKQYQKKKRTLDMIDEQIAEIESNISYLESVLESFRKCNEISEINEIKQELIKNKFIKPDVKTKQSPLKASKYIEYTVDGFTIIAGKNNIQNEELTFKLATPDDIWLHAKNTHGSHVVIFNPKNLTLPDNVIEVAAKIAAYNSKAYLDLKVEVDYTLKKYVKKPNGGKTGFVTYSNQKSIIVQPNANEQYKKT